MSPAFVFAETHATFARSLAVRERIIADLWEDPLLHLAEVTDADHRKAIALLRRHGDKSYPFCDAISFVVMQRLGVGRVAAFDDHFRQFGGFDMVVGECLRTDHGAFPVLGVPPRGMSSTTT